MKKGFSIQSQFLAVFLAVCGISACASGALAVTGCTPIIGKLPTDAPGIECPSYSPTTPCVANNFNPSTWGPLTQCIIDGEDPPSSDPHWNEPPEGYVSQGGVLNTQACGPPTPALGINSMNGNPYRPSPYMLNCPASVQPVIPFIR